MMVLDALHGVHDWADVMRELATGWMAMAVYNALLSALPEPLLTERWYGFFYKFIHILGINIDRLRTGH